MVYLLSRLSGRLLCKICQRHTLTQNKSVVNSVRRLLDGQVRETFLKGYRYNIQYESTQYAIGKSINGLQRFLELPVEFYSARLSSDLPLTEAIALRQLTSGMFCGIIEGYSSLEFDEASADELLSEYVRTWGYVLPFMTGRTCGSDNQLPWYRRFPQRRECDLIPVTHRWTGWRKTPQTICHCLL